MLELTKKKWLLSIVLLAFVSSFAVAAEMEEAENAEAVVEEMADEVGHFDIDVGHSTIGFAVKHLQVGTTRGSFTDYTGKIAYDPEDLSLFSADVTIQTASIDTKVEARDKHLKSGDFFEVEKYPTITFKSNRLEKRGEGMVLVGDLTIKEVTKTLTVPVTVSGPVNSPFGAT
ncbi:MAG: YceI family protein, partial [Candidatus Omnitrophica bacterium]|nr:YceI family protein [Candidatus Omnitrophota bacterium]